MAPRSKRNAVSYFNIMVVGSVGVGKTSLVKTLAAALSEDVPNEKRDSALSQSEQRTPLDGPLTPTMVPYTVSVNAEVDGDKIALTLIDTPGFYNDFRMDKQLHDIIGYIEHQFDLTLAEESKVKRNPKAVDTQVHACLYVIDSKKQALDEYDLRILSQLSQRVNVVPVVGRADTLTLAQRRRLKPTIMHDIYTLHKIPVYGMPEDEPEDGEAPEQEHASSNSSSNNNNTTAGSSLENFLSQFHYEQEDEETQTFIDYLRLIPFAVIAYEEDPETGKPIAMEGIKIGRDYGWAQIDCLSDDYSDFNALKTILLSTHRRILKAETVERYYEQYRTERLLASRAAKLKSMDAGQKLLEALHKI
ncbi:Septin-type guanine nucleotide-binding (G) domain-containing protein [Dichotomocladium elegans]|nr:Septin-type guanine nucleotide-binding (G) domain-containing protein [Dichotomocladium elegans]